MMVKQKKSIPLLFAVFGTSCLQKESKLQNTSIQLFCSCICVFIVNNSMKVRIRIQLMLCRYILGVLFLKSKYSNTHWNVVAFSPYNGVITIQK